MDECVIPIFNEFADAEFPGFVKPCFEETVRQARDRFVNTPGLTKLACHQIDSVESPARVPPRRIPAHFQQEVQEQMNDMLKKGIIVESSSSWLAPAVYTRKKKGEIRLCMDYREANKRTRKDTYPLPLIDEVQDRLSGATIFRTSSVGTGKYQWTQRTKRRQHSHLVLEWDCSSSQGLMWGTQHIPETHGCGDARTAICHRLHR